MGACRCASERSPRSLGSKRLAWRRKRRTYSNNPPSRSMTIAPSSPRGLHSEGAVEKRRNGRVLHGQQRRQRCLEANPAHVELDGTLASRDNRQASSPAARFCYFLPDSAERFFWGGFPRRAPFSSAPPARQLQLGVRCPLRHHWQSLTLQQRDRTMASSFLCICLTVVLASCLVVLATSSDPPSLPLPSDFSSPISESAVRQCRTQSYEVVFEAEEARRKFADVDDTDGDLFCTRILVQSQLTCRVAAAAVACRWRKTAPPFSRCRCQHQKKKRFNRADSLPTDCVGCAG